MSADGPLLPSEPLDAADERLLATFDEIEKQQLLSTAQTHLRAGHRRWPSRSSSHRREGRLEFRHELHELNWLL
ncbi:hypothetical protein [Candidatus Amarolinea dominans]|uniref:hypothetical protein n=1 Tax=Candidatus Amarolinea dominans TaxID=3140696 RepID=UPI0031366D5F|nr:hypothetical protein [Anaerolineae bacterium]